MRLPWNRKYLEIGFHVILTAGILVLLGAVVFKLNEAKNVILQTARQILAVFAPFFWAVGISVVLEPAVAFWQRQYERVIGRRGKRRCMGTAITYLIFFCLLFGLGSILVRKVGTADMEKVAEQLGEFVRQAGDLLVLFQLKLAEYGLLQNVESIFTTAVTQISLQIEESVLHAAAALPKTGGQVFHAGIGFTAAFYFLSEKENVQFFVRQVGAVFLGEKMAKRIGGVLGEIYRVFMGYLGGQMLDATIMGTLFAVAFYFIGIPYGILIGLVSGFSNLIPYFGAIVAFLLAVLSGLLSEEPIRALYAAIAILVLQQIDSVWIVPKVVGKKVELHPVMVLLSLAIFGGFFGFWGLLLAVPLGALCKNFFFWLYEKKAAEKNGWKH